MTSEDAQAANYKRPPSVLDEAKSKLSRVNVEVISIICITKQT